MKIKFIGAVGGEVTGSCILCCTNSGTRFLVDCGAFQGNLTVTPTKNNRFPFDPRTIDFVLLTHAHLDHCGRIPDLYECGFNGYIICNKATRDLAILNMMDSMNHIELPKKVKFPKDEKAWKKRFITEEEIPQVGNRGIPFNIGNIQISMMRSSHFLGSTSFSISWWKTDVSSAEENKQRSRTICFSGDLGSVIDGAENHLSLLRDGFVPWSETDYIVMESTYGSKTRDPEYKNFDNRIKRLDELASADNIDTLILACFSMQRAQDVLFDLVYLAIKKDHCLDITLDSTMGIKACEIFKEALTYIKPAGWGKKKFVHLNDKDFAERFLPLLGKGHINSMSEDNQEEYHNAIKSIVSDILSGKLNHDNVIISFKGKKKEKQSENNPTQRSTKREAKKVFIATSGMFHDGPILQHLRERCGDDRAAFIITGFCRSTDNGRTMSAWLNNDKDADKLHISVPGEKIHRTRLKAKIYDVAPYYSGHADAEGLMRFLFYSERPPKEPFERRQVTVFLNHGEAYARANLKEKIEEESKDPKNQKVRKIKQVLLPNATDTFFDLDKEEWVSAPNDLLSPNWISFRAKRKGKKENKEEEE